MEWYEELDFDENPFAYNGKMVGQGDLMNELFYTIISGNMALVKGEHGSGKTRLLKEIIKKFGGRRKLAYIDCKKIKELNIEKVIINRNGFLGWLFKIIPKEMVLLLDNVEEISIKNAERIKHFYDQNTIRSVIFATSSPEKINFTESLRQRLNKVLSIRPISDYEAVMLVRGYIGYNLFSDSVIKEVYHKSNRNIGSFLQNCERLCREAVKRGLTNKVTEKDVGMLIGAG